MTKLQVLGFMKRPGISWSLYPLEVPGYKNLPECKIRGVAHVPPHGPILFDPLTWALYCERGIYLPIQTDVYFLSHLLDMSLRDTADILLAAGCWDPKKVDMIKNRMLEIMYDAKNRTGD